MSNTLVKQLTKISTLIPGYTIRSWVPETRTIYYRAYGYYNGSKVYSPYLGIYDTFNYNPNVTQAYYVGGVSYSLEGGVPVTSGDYIYIPSWWGNVTIVTKGYDYQLVIQPGYYTYYVQPDTYRYSFNNILGWDAAAVSVKKISGDCTLYTSVSVSSIGVSFGLNTLDTSSGNNYREIPFGFICTRGTYRVIENGNLKSGIFNFEANTIFAISRKDGVIYYTVDGVLVYISLSQTLLDLLVDSSLYSAGDSLVNTSFVEGSPIVFSGLTLSTSSYLGIDPQPILNLSAYSTFSFPNNYTTNNDVYSSVYSFSGSSSLINNQFLSYIPFTSNSTLSFISRVGCGVTALFGEMSALLSGGYQNYTAIITPFPQMVASASTTGIVLAPPSYLAGLTEGLTANIVSLIGGTTNPSLMSLPSMTGLLSDHPYAEINSSMQSMVVSAYMFEDYRDVGHNAHITDHNKVNSSLLYYQLSNLVEQIILNSSLLNKVNTKVILTEYLTTITSLIITLKGSISDNIVIADSVLSLLKKIEIISNNLSYSDTLNTKVSISNIIIDLIKTISTLDRVTVGLVSENIGVSVTLSSLYKAIVLLVGSINNIDTLSNKKIQVIGLGDTLLNSSTLSNNTLFKSVVSDSFLITIPTISGGDTYLAYLLSPETNSISNYDNYNFSGSTKFGFKYLFSNSTGLYEYGGNTDDSSLITARLQTVAYDFGSSNLKQVPAVYLGYSSSGSTIMKVSVNGKNSSIYKLNKRTENLQTQKVDIGKGLIGRYFQFELVTQAPEFSMESIEFYPVELRRKL